MRPGPRRTPPRAASLTPLDAVVLALSTFRLTRLVGQDDFPPVKRARERLIGRFGEGHAVVEAVTCPWCASIYVGAAVLFASRSPVLRRLLLVPALSAVTGVVSTLDSTLGRAWPEPERVDVTARLRALDMHNPTSAYP
jgi:hypothetical protein